jgi:hypothetical protein
VGFHGFKAAHDEFEQAVADALARVELIEIVGNGAVERFFDAIHRFAQRGAVEIRHWAIGRIGQFGEGHVAPGRGRGQGQGGAGQIAADGGVQSSGQRNLEA